MIRDTAREFVEAYVKPDIGEHFESGTFPTELIPTMGEIGVYAPNLEGNGITTDYSPMRHMANVETVYTYEGTHDIHTLILGEDLTGIPAYS